MSGNVNNLLRRDFYSLWSETGAGVFIFIPLIIMSPAAPALKLFTLVYFSFSTFCYNSTIFVQEEKYRVAGYFASLPVRRKEIVLARYFGVVVLLALHLALAYSGNLAFKLLGMSKFQLPPGYFALSIIAVSLLTSLSLPFYFKFGAAKATAGLTIGIVGIVFGTIFLAGKKPEFAEMVRDLLLTNVFETSVVLIAAAILLFVVSIKISMKIYAKKDL